MSSMTKHDAKPSRLKRLNRIEGQVRGITRMVEDDRYCIDILTQIAAVRAALQKVEQDVLEEHMHHCVHEAFTSGSDADQRAKITELMELLARAAR